MKKISLIPYGDISLLSLTNTTSETKFRLYSKVKEIVKDEIILFDDNSEHSFPYSSEFNPDIKKDDVVLVFGVKDESGIEIDQIIRMNLNWSHLVKLQSLEQM